MSTTAPLTVKAKPKRKRKVLSLEDKLLILDRMSKGERQVDLASEFGVGTSTVADLKKKEGRIREFVATMDSLSVSMKERKIMRLADDERLDEAVYLWFIQKRSLGIPVTGVVLSEKATQFHEQLHILRLLKSLSKRARVGCGGSATDTE